MTVDGSVENKKEEGVRTINQVPVLTMMEKIVERVSKVREKVGWCSH